MPGCGSDLPVPTGQSPPLVKEDEVMKRSLRFAALALLLASLGSPVLGQTVTGTVTGTVTDTSGAVVAGVSVVARNQKTGIEYTTRSNPVGAYTIASVPIGDYVIHAE